MFKDTINHYSIEIPKGWQSGFSKNPNAGILFQAIRPKEANETFTDSYNINQVPSPNSSVDLAYNNMLETISQNIGYEFVSSGDTIIDDKKYKWLIQKHSNAYTNDKMQSYIYLGYRNGIAYMISFTAKEENFKNLLSLFKKISDSFRLE